MEFYVEVYIWFVHWTLIDNRLVHAFTHFTFWTCPPSWFVTVATRMMAQIMDKIFVPNRKIAFAMALHLYVHFCVCKNEREREKKHWNHLEIYTNDAVSVSFERWINRKIWHELLFTQNNTHTDTFTENDVRIYKHFNVSIQIIYRWPQL